MKFFATIIEELVEEMDSLSFPVFVYEARERLGIKQYRAATHIGITLARLRCIEEGNFTLLKKYEVSRIATVYGLPEIKLVEMAQDFVNFKDEEKNISNGKSRKYNRKEMPNVRSDEELRALLHAGREETLSG